MKFLNRQTISANKYTEKIVQFGEGNFLRGFANWMIHKMNVETKFNSGVVVVQPIEEGVVDLLNEQDGLYTVYLNGLKNGKAVSEFEIIDCIQRGINPYKNPEEYLNIANNPELRFVISNTTEAGISYKQDDSFEDTPQSSFPGKLTSLLYRRFKIFKGAPNKGLIIIPCELIERNGDKLKKIIFQYINDWQLEESFKMWIENDNFFCNTLVDRIVPGYPEKKMGDLIKKFNYKDKLVVECEQFYLWVIEGPQFLEKEIPANACGLNVIFTRNMEPYRNRKVRILNGAHTALVPVSFLYGIDKVRESLEDEIVGSFIKKLIFNEICPTLDDQPEKEIEEFANEVIDRFKNPYLDHFLLSISLNSTSKFKTRVIPSILKYINVNKKLPKLLLFSLASQIAFNKGQRNGKQIPLKDDPSILAFYKNTWENNDIPMVVKSILKHVEFWGHDLTKIEGLDKVVTNYLINIENKGMSTALTDLVIGNNFTN